MPDLIDHEFLSNLEGGSRLAGYVPAVNISKSGVTVATGFDFGQRNEGDLKVLGLTPNLINILKPYLGITGAQASELIRRAPLVLNAEQAKLIDKSVKSSHVSKLCIKYNADVKGNLKFYDLPAEAQTVIASVSFQYGVGLHIRAPKFWSSVIRQDWEAAIVQLKAFGDAYPTRRRKEAALLETMK
ncbi:pesticin C-terminus-like muramidase [Thalassolituus marinus]|uniref:Peptidase n=1 Tax=Thalassolituus marinus TaxID=671053 RepID=A0ABS7ZP30_9GAMM|nr:pesticin C-terminus-like muramidase [Thalassolituus marinus]MCA6063448.1 peptidase [Thalassolituus marinus]